MQHRGARAAPRPLPGLVLTDSDGFAVHDLGLDVIEHVEGATSWSSFLLQVVWTDLDQLAVDAAVNVACWCESDHAIHDVDALRIVVGDN
ncbi:hypothetical protein OG285_35375 [Streptomyces sp. NBC_01471]|uniref:hypothetical protein n=1 Tax=Streptomyces sp. NBC_01471 TaxID=2903879 RepID=UPI00325671A8